jgi:hypothetical protein
MLTDGSTPTMRSRSHYMQTTDINGSKNISRRSLQGAGANIMSNVQMTAAGSKKVARPG